jgi:hypothetical protein
LIRVVHDAVPPKIDTSEESESDLFVSSIRYFLRDANFIYRASALSRIFSGERGFWANIGHGKGQYDGMFVDQTIVASSQGSPRMRRRDFAAIANGFVV